MMRDQTSASASTAAATPTAPRDGAEPVQKKVGLWNRVLWLLMRVALVTPSLREIQERKYPLAKGLPEHEIAEAEARFLFQLAESASDHTDDKIKQLLTLSSSLVTVLALFGDRVQPRILVVIVALTLLVSVLMCVTALGVRRWAVPDVFEPTGAEDSDTWARNLLQATYTNRSFHAFRVDQYRSALRYFVAALIATGLLALLVDSTDNSADLSKTLKSMQDNGVIMRSPPPPLPPLLPPWHYP